MSRRGSSGGGHSSLGYLFGSGEQPPNHPSAPSPSRVVDPPYGIDKEDEVRPMNLPPQKQENHNKNHRTQGQNSGNFITDRPTTKVKSVPGGNSSLGYLFGDK